MAKFALILISILGIGYCSEFDVQHREHELHQFSNVQQIGYSTGSGLHSIARGSVRREESAVANQEVAVAQAKFVTKRALAMLTSSASATANAALSASDILVKNLKNEQTNPQQSLNTEREQMILAQKTDVAANKLVKQSSKEVEILAEALKNIQLLFEKLEEEEKRSSSQKSVASDAEHNKSLPKPESHLRSLVTDPPKS